MSILHADPNQYMLHPTSQCLQAIAPSVPFPEKEFRLATRIHYPTNTTPQTI
jgi:hypothetical protein